MKKFLLLVTLLATFQLTFAQRVPVTVTVTDETGSGLPGANVLVKGTTDGGITDANGKLTLNATPDAVLQISSIGYTTKEITVGNQTSISHQMVLDVTQLSEVVVTGYATEQKKDIVGSVSVVKTDQLMVTPAANVASQLQGRSAGVTVNTDGTPGGSAKVRVRGVGSFGNSDPLYVIDGVPGGNIANLNPQDIESLQVLKDAASASIYGARAANGVVVITTKQGKTGTPAKVSFDSYYAENYFAKSNFPDMLNAQEYADMYWGLMKGAHTTLGASDTQYVPGGAGWTHPQYGTGVNPVLPEYILVKDNGVLRGGTYLEGLRASNPTAFNALVAPSAYNFETHQIVKGADTDWFKETFKPAAQQSYQVGVNGGSNTGNYAVSMNIYDQNNTTSPYAWYKRYTLRSNTSFKIGKSIRIGENVQLGYINQRPGANTAQTWTMTASIPVYDIMGNPASSAAPGLVAVGDTGRNPITEAWRARFNKDQTYTIFGNVFAEVDIIKGLTARTSFGIDMANRSRLDFTPATYEHAENTAVSGQNLNRRYDQNTTWTWTNTLAYSKTFADVHNFKILGGLEAINAYAENISATRTSQNNTVPAYALDQDPNFMVLDA
ncbi:MAG TPA: SusC/RagA family TonB-linked outer membrane protein, partial [Cyclobacteriaceae bacterium]|nr:SusC/RagA family TonB-linked outer membrane protein [Cyclobacteriaceae bacterium]